MQGRDRNSYERVEPAGHYLRNVLRSTQLQQLQAFAVFLPCTPKRTKAHYGAEIVSPISARNVGHCELKESTMPRLDEQLDREAVRIVALARHLSTETGLAQVCPEVYGVAILAFGPNAATRDVKSLGGNARLHAHRTPCWGMRRIMGIIAA